MAAWWKAGKGGRPRLEAGDNQVLAKVFACTTRG